LRQVAQRQFSWSFWMKLWALQTARLLLEAWELLREPGLHLIRTMLKKGCSSLIRQAQKRRYKISAELSQVRLSSPSRVHYLPEITQSSYEARQRRKSSEPEA